MAWLERIRAFVRRAAPRPERVAIDDEGVTRDLGDGRREHVAWAKLAEVVVVTTSAGPFAEDVWFLLGDVDGAGCAVGNEAAQSAELVERLLRLDGFDHTAFMAAMASTDDRRFVVWKPQR